MPQSEKIRPLVPKAAADYMNPQVDDVRIREIQELAPPSQVIGESHIGQDAEQLVLQTRRDIHRVLHGEDDRLVVIVGPCSVHNVEAAREYAQRLLALKRELAQELVIVMRVYFEKPRTTIGWKGLINDPDLDGSFQINKGLRIARQFLLDLNQAGMPAATEFLDMITPQYYADLVSWGAIGARTTESQVHRELASGLSCPVGFKNGTDGNVRIAVDAIKSASASHHFLSVTKAGRSAIVTTNGNDDCHIILRGGSKAPNYDAASIDAACQQLAGAGLAQHLMIDVSHANSQKQYQRQIDVTCAIADQIEAGDARILGVMIESHLKEGRQNVGTGKNLVYGQSITDACISWDDTVTLLQRLAESVRRRRAVVAAA